MLEIHRLYFLYQRSFEAIEMLLANHAQPALLAAYVRLAQELGAEIRQRLGALAESAGASKGMKRAARASSAGADLRTAA